MGEPLKHENLKLRSCFYSNFLRPGLYQNALEDSTAPGVARPSSSQSVSVKDGPCPRPRSSCWQALPGRCRPAMLRRDALLPSRISPKTRRLNGPLVTRDGVDIEIAVVEDRRDYAVEVSQSSVSPSQGSMHLNTHAPVDLGNPSLDRARSEETAIVVGLKQDCNKVGSSNDVSSMLEINIENDDRVDVVDRSESAIEFHGQDSSTWGNSLEHEEVSEPRYKNVVSAPAHIIAKVRGRAAAEAKEVWARIAEAQSKNLQKLANRWAMACHIPGDAQSQVCILATVGASDGCTLTTSHPQDTSAVGESESSSAREGRGCIHRAVRESVQTPGPGHYEIAPARVDSSTLQPWARRGTLLREKNLARFDLDRDAGLLGPGYYDAKQIARCVGGVFNQAKRRNVYSRNFVDSSYVARESTQFDVIEACNQALATKFPSTPVPRLDHCTNDANLDYKSATWRLGGNLIISAPGGPCNSATESRCWRHERPPWCRERAARLAASWHVRRR